ncbi:hypothetical protein B0H19DRAFT_1240725 [Mycena capillaripes]|nr:hypothetical protein B0H19DRAFT_1240725 [Mycena capillaripes]
MPKYQQELIQIAMEVACTPEVVGGHPKPKVMSLWLNSKCMGGIENTAWSSEETHQPSCTACQLNSVSHAGCMNEPSRRTEELGLRVPFDRPVDKCRICDRWIPTFESVLWTMQVLFKMLRYRTKLPRFFAFPSSSYLHDTVEIRPSYVLVIFFEIAATSAFPPHSKPVQSRWIPTVKINRTKYIDAHDGTLYFSTGCRDVVPASGATKPASQPLGACHGVTLSAFVPTDNGCIILTKCQNHNVLVVASAIPNLAGEIWANMVGDCGSTGCPLTQQKYIDFIYGAMSTGVTDWPRHTAITEPSNQLSGMPVTVFFLPGEHYADLARLLKPWYCLGYRVSSAYTQSRPLLIQSYQVVNFKLCLDSDSVHLILALIDIAGTTNDVQDRLCDAGSLDLIADELQTGDYIWDLHSPYYSYLNYFTRILSRCLESLSSPLNTVLDGRFYVVFNIRKIQTYQERKGVQNLDQQVPSRLLWNYYLRAHLSSGHLLLRTEQVSRVTTTLQLSATHDLSASTTTLGWVSNSTQVSHRSLHRFTQTRFNKCSRGRGMEHEIKVWVNVSGDIQYVYSYVASPGPPRLKGIPRTLSSLAHEPLSEFAISLEYRPIDEELKCARAAVVLFRDGHLSKTQASILYITAKLCMMQPRSVLTPEAPKLNQSIGAYFESISDSNILSCPGEYGRFDDEPFANATTYV